LDIIGKGGFVIVYHGEMSGKEVEGICLKPFCIIMEYCDSGDLYNYIHEWTTPISWKLRLQTILDIARGIQYMHEQTPKIAHLDIKTLNKEGNKGWCGGWCGKFNLWGKKKERASKYR